MRFVLLLLVMTLPFWALAELVQVEPLPGLPLSGLMAFMPAVAAAILAARAQGRAGLRAFLARAFDWGRMRGHALWTPLLLLIPAAAAASWAIQGHDPASPGAAPWILAVMLLAFFAAGVGEELGWCGYLLEPLARRWGELAAALVIGVVWAMWHLVPFLQAGRAADWIAWHMAMTIALRVVTVRLYFGAGRSVFVTALFHAFCNVGFFGLPMYGGTYDSRFTAVAIIVVAVALWLAVAVRRPAS
ncbi:MAG: CPBP family intramembrane metalloprotease [Phenylobacterium sp.]|uniref:CPBP family intramembrane glutamic endopeptidase n=1 Tax=Phenylobacterium sp. TaxID=1871053 RepID=UPI001A24242C|nr:CPBP family intramembrane glutamic endopeptidase [Phenylobacterium sp.]MBJ7410335.1 CPBP family intramembrane metalloprotease [Phenylobacterium sp.]